jgi:hypothetical protein
MGSRRILTPPAESTPRRKVLDPEVLATKAADKKKGESKTSRHVVKTPDGAKPKPESQPSRRELVAIKAGQLVRIRGDRDNKYVVMADPNFSTRRENGMARGKVIVVELLGPNGVIEVPIRYLIPVYA